MSTDDLSDLLTQQWTADAGPRPGFGGHGTPPKYGQGTVEAWDTETGENQIRYHGAVLSNLPIIGSTDILVIQPGDQVAIMSWAPNGGSGAYWIVGRLVVPGTEAATRSIQFMQGELAKTISAQVFAERISTDEDEGVGTITPPAGAGVFGPFSNLTGADVGPQVTATVGAAGKMLVMVTAEVTISVYDNAAWFGAGGMVSFELSGANALNPGRPRSMLSIGAGVVHNALLTDSAALVSMTTRATAVEVVSGLTPGNTTVTCKYAAYGGNPRPVRFNNRELIAVAF